MDEKQKYTIYENIFSMEDELTKHSMKFHQSTFTKKLSRKI